MRKISLLLVTVVLFLGCSRVPITDRKQNTLINESELQKMSETEYQKFLASNKISTNAAQTQLVKKVGMNISTNITSFFKTYKNGKYFKDISDYKWEFNLVDDPNVNAWCMPGGKVVVYSGLLPVTQNETGLAVVMGHEIAHAIAKHGNERMSQQLKAQALGDVLSIAVSGSPQATQDIFNLAYGISGNLSLLKYSRANETEADKIGVVFMALAGYDPNEAIPFWERMGKMSSGSKPPQFMSTHPSDAQRVNDLKAWMPTALKYYNKP